MAGRSQGGTPLHSLRLPGRRAKPQDSVFPIAWAEASWGKEQRPSLDSGIWVCGSFFLRARFYLWKALALPEAGAQALPGSLG